jgi:hypothetical protein
MLDLLEGEAESGRASDGTIPFLFVSLDLTLSFTAALGAALVVRV